MTLLVLLRSAAGGGGSTATNEPFYPTGTTGQLQIGGVDVVSGAMVTSIVRADWQGSLNLRTTARTNFVTNSNDPTAWTITTSGTGSAVVATLGFTGPSGAANAARLQLNKGAGTTASDLSVIRATFAGTTAGQLEASSFWLKSNTGANQTVTITGSGIEPFATITVTPTWQRFTVNAPGDTIQATSGNISIRLQGDLTPTVNTADILVAYAQVEQGSNTPSGVIVTSGGPVSITDIVSVSDSGAVVLGQTASGSDVWSGSGTLAAGPTTLPCPAPSSMTLAGLAASLALTLSCPAPPSITLATLAPSLQRALAAPVPASVALSGLAPSLARTIQAPAPVALTLAGLAPSLSAGVVTLVCPTPTSVSLAGLAPAIQPTLAAPAPVALSLTGTAPALARSLVAPTPSALSLAALTPSLAQSLACPSPSALTLTGLAPTLQTSGTLVCPAPSALVLAGDAPALVATLRAPAPSALTLAPLAPSLARGLACPTPAAITLAANAPTLSRAIQAPVPASMTLVGYAPTLLISTVIQCPAPSSVALSGLAPSLRVTVRPTPGVMTLQGLAPSLAVPQLLETDPRYLVSVVKVYTQSATPRAYVVNATPKAYTSTMTRQFPVIPVVKVYEVSA